MSKQSGSHHNVAIIGTGFSGLGMAIKLKEEGENDFVVFEKEAGVGGTWRVNHYPGCACDVPSHLYSYSFEPNPEWSRMFSPQQEIKRYLEGCAKKYGVLPHVQFENAIEKAVWDQQQAVWRLTDAKGQQHTANMLVAGPGALSAPSYPDIPGLDTFKGAKFHSQQWDHHYNLHDKRVAVIGTGASAIQFVPQIQKQVAQLNLFQRTPPWIMPKPDRAMKWWEKAAFKKLPAAQQALRDSIYWQLESRVAGFVLSPRLMSLGKRMALSYLRKTVKDPELRKKLTPDYALGCKRVLMSNDYLQSLSQPNVDVITTGIKEVRANSIVTNDGTEHPIDAIIFGTGFKATDPIPKGLVFGADGADLSKKWEFAPEAYKGTTVSGYPNLFMLMGPNTGLGHTSMVYMIESQINYVIQALRFMKKNNVQAVDVSIEAQQTYNEEIQNKLSNSVWNQGGCQSWYLHPVSGKNVTLWPGFTWQYRNRTRRFDSGAYALIKTAEQSLTQSSAQEASA